MIGSPSSCRNEHSSALCFDRFEHADDKGGRMVCIYCICAGTLPYQWPDNLQYLFSVELSNNNLTGGLLQRVVIVMMQL